MAGGNVKRGFLTYLFILLLMIIAAFLIFVLIMVFQPFKSVLGYTYLKYSDDNYHYNILNEESDERLDFSKINQININCDFAQVKVESFTKVDDVAIRIENNSRGFAHDNQRIGFSYDISFGETNNIINVDITEPEAFLFTSKNIVVSVLVPAEGNYALENTKLSITSKSGTVILGNAYKLANGDNILNAADIDVKTDNGEVIIYPNIDKTFNSIAIKSNSGNISVYSDIETNEFELNSGSGKVLLEDVTITKKDGLIKLNLADSKFNAKELTGNVDFTVKNGYVDVDTINGAFRNDNQVDQMDYAKLRINNIYGDILLPYFNNSSIVVKNVGNSNSNNQVYIDATSGSIQIDSIYGESWIKTTSGNVNVHTYSNDISVKTDNGRIDVIYESTAIANQLDFETISGEINVKLRNDLAFVVNVENTKGETRDSKNIVFEGFGEEITFPLVVNQGTKVMKIVSDGRINISYIGIEKESV